MALTAEGARPTVRLNGQELDNLRDLMQTMEMHESEGGLSSLEMSFSRVESRPRQDARLAFDDAAVDFGQEIIVYGGPENQPNEIFRGAISALEHRYPEDSAPEFVLLAEDGLQKARMHRRTRFWKENTLKAIAESIGQSLGLRPNISGLTDSIGPQMQWNESDLAFLRRLCRRYDADLQMTGNELHLSPRKDVQRPPVVLNLHEELRSVRVIADLSQQTTQVTVAGWDHSNGSRIKFTSQGANRGPGGGTTGAEVLKRTFGVRSEHLGPVAVTTEAEAKALAHACFDQRARGFVTVHGVATGSAKLRVGTTATLTGLGNRFDNSYYIVDAWHRYDQKSGYRTEFRAESATAGRV